MSVSNWPDEPRSGPRFRVPGPIIWDAPDVQAEPWNDQPQPVEGDPWNYPTAPDYGGGEHNEDIPYDDGLAEQTDVNGNPLDQPVMPSEGTSHEAVSGEGEGAGTVSQRMHRVSYARLAQDDEVAQGHIHSARERKALSAAYVLEATEAKKAFHRFVNQTRFYAHQKKI